MSSKAKKEEHVGDVEDAYEALGDLVSHVPFSQCRVLVCKVSRGRVVLKDMLKRSNLVRSTCRRSGELRRLLANQAWDFSLNVVHKVDALCGSNTPIRGPIYLLLDA